MARLVENTGWTLGEIDALYLDDVMVLFAHWRKHPPLRDLVEMLARYIGYKPAADVKATPARAPTVAEIKLLYPDGIVRG